MATTVKDYAPGDEEQLVELYDTDGARRRIERGWPWRHVHSPSAFEHPVAVVAWEGDRPIGYASATRVALSLRGERVVAAHVSSGALCRMTPSEALNTELQAALIERLEQTDVKLAFAAVFEDQMAMFQEVGFEYLFEVYARNLYIGLESLSRRVSKAALEPFRRIAREARRVRHKLVEEVLDERTIAIIANLLSSTRDAYDLAVEKDEAYLKWRYLEDPRTHYRLLTYRSKAGQGIGAFAIVRRFQTDRGRALFHLDEHWTREPGRRAQGKLMGELALFGLTEEVDVLRGFAAAGSHTEQALIGTSCIRKKVDRCFVVRPIGVGAPTLPSPFPTKDVYLKAGDVELYES